MRLSDGALKLFYQYILNPLTKLCYQKKINKVSHNRASKITQWQNNARKRCILVAARVSQSF